MSKFNDAATAIRKAAVKYEQMVGLAAILDEIGSLDQVAAESKKAAEAAKAEALKAKDDAKKAKDKLEDVQVKADKIHGEAVAESAAIIRAAEERAAEIERAGQEKAAAMITAATIESHAVASGTEQSIAAARAEVNRLMAESAMITKQIDAQKDELAKLEKAMADSKKKLAALLG